MAVKRRGWKFWLMSAAMLVGLFGGPLAVVAATTERVVSDRHTGLAIGGFDPIAYFTDYRPMPGRADYEYVLDGVVWRFVNEGNREAFIKNPDVYRPRFGGYDPTAVKRGVAVAGNPLIWRIAKDQLFLFADEQARAAFDADPAAVSGAAATRWPDVESGLAQ